MKETIKYIVLILFSIIVAEVVALFFFFLRYLTDSLGLSAQWYLIVPFLISLLTTLIIYLLAKKFKLKYSKPLAILIFILWIFLWFSSLFQALDKYNTA